MASPPLTIGLPVYNGADHLASTVRSIESQTFTDYVVLISDNASVDGTEALCRDYAARDERVRYVRQDVNLGGAANFNYVATQAVTEFFKWASHDDLMEPIFLERTLAEMDRAPSDVILCYPRTTLIDGDDLPIRHFDDGLDLREDTPHERLRHYLMNYEMSNPIFGIVRHALLMRTGLLGSYASADKVLMAEMSMVGSFREIPDRLFMRRYHEGMSLKANVTPEEIAAWFDPNRPRPVTMLRTKLFLEYTRSIASSRLGLSVSERRRCLQVLLATGGWHELHVIGGEMKREALVGVRRTANRLSSRTTRAS